MQADEFGWTRLQSKDVIRRNHQTSVNASIKLDHFIRGSIYFLLVISNYFRRVSKKYIKKITESMTLPFNASMTMHFT